MTILIREAGPDDTATVVEFNARLAAESEGKRLDRDLLTRGVGAILGDPGGRGRYFLASLEGRIVGQLSITFEWSDWRNGWFWWFQSVYVDGAARRAGVFSALFDHVAGLARVSDDVCGLRLYVDDRNEDAQKVYAAKGLRRAGYHVMEIDFRLGGEEPA